MIMKKILTTTLAVVMVIGTGVGITNDAVSSTVNPAITASAATTAATSIANAKVTIPEATWHPLMNANTPVHPKVTVKLGNVTLKQGTDYTVSYDSSCINTIGSGAVTIKGKGKYTGTTVGHFRIARASIKNTFTDDNFSAFGGICGFNKLPGVLALNNAKSGVNWTGIKDATNTKGTKVDMTTWFNCAAYSWNVKNSSGKVNADSTVSASYYGIGNWTDTNTVKFDVGTKTTQIPIGICVHTKGANSIVAYINGNKINLKKMAGSSNYYSATATIKFTQKFGGKTYKNVKIYYEENTTGSTKIVSAYEKNDGIINMGKHMSFGEGVNLKNGTYYNIYLVKNGSTTGKLYVYA